MIEAKGLVCTRGEHALGMALGGVGRRLWRGQQRARLRLADKARRAQRQLAPHEPRAARRLRRAEHRVPLALEPREALQDEEERGHRAHGTRPPVSRHGPRAERGRPRRGLGGRRREQVAADKAERVHMVEGRRAPLGSIERLGEQVLEPRHEKTIKPAHFWR